MARNKPKRAAQPPLADGCIFDGTVPRTKEHLYGRWTIDIVPPSLKAHRRTVTDGPSDIGKKTSRKGAGDPATMTVKAVCARCNNEWMKDIEDATRPVMTPLLLGDTAKLSLDDLRQLATWITLKSIVGEFIDPSATAIPKNQRKEFFDSRKPLESWEIWIGRHGGKESRHFWHAVANVHWEPSQDRSTWSKPDVGDRTRFNTQITVITLGKLVMVAFSTLEPNVSFRAQALSDYGDSLIQVWPTTPRLPLLWPPPHAVDDAMTEILHREPRIFGEYRGKLKPRRLF